MSRESADLTARLASHIAAQGQRDRSLLARLGGEASSREYQVAEASRVVFTTDPIQSDIRAGLLRREAKMNGGAMTPDAALRLVAYEVIAGTWTDDAASAYQALYEAGYEGQLGFV